MMFPFDFETDWEATHLLYRLWLHSEGLEVEADPEKGERGRKGFTHEELQAVGKLEGKMPRGKALRCRVRYFSDGQVFGSVEFVNQVFERNRSYFSPKRASGARKMRGAAWGGLSVARDLRKTVISVP